MFCGRDPQTRLFQPSMLLPDAKRQRLEASWPGTFRDEALPLIDVEAFRDFYCADNGRPTKAVETVVAVLILKDMFDLTDAETVYRVDFDLGFHTALALEPETAHVCQKTLHNFRTKLMTNARERVLFAGMTDGILGVLGTDVSRQRQDSSHILSNIRLLSRLQLFCETLRLFLRAAQGVAPGRYAALGASLRGRYMKEDGHDTAYGDARKDEARRRLSVCARDVWRVLEHFRGDAAVAALPECQMLERLFVEQCEVAPDAAPEADAEDAWEAPVPVAVKPAKVIESDTLQTPHDPTVTYGHKGQGYEVQVLETFGNADGPEIITHVEVTPSCRSDKHAVNSALDEVAARDVDPATLVADTTYGTTENVIACAKRGVEQVSPVGGRPEPLAEGLTAGDFALDPTGAKPTVCPGGHTPVEETREPKTGAVAMTFAAAGCAACPHRDRCPSRPRPDGTREFKTTVHNAVLERRRRDQTTDAFRQTYAQRAGIEATNSELKRRHGLGELRVRGAPAVTLAVYLKALACNTKRMVNHFAQRRKQVPAMG